LGLYQVVIGNMQDRIINVITGSSLSFTVIPFDYNKAPWWQKMIVIIYALFLLVAIVYVIVTDFIQ
jgi:hypothetical protein